MQQKDPLKIEVWVDGRFYGKYEVNPDGYDPIAMMRHFKEMVQRGEMPSANRIEIRKGL